MSTFYQTSVRLLLGISIFLPTQIVFGQEPSAGVPELPTSLPEPAAKAIPNHRTLVVPLQYANASFVVRTIEQLLDRKKFAYDYSIVADSESSQILLRGDETTLEEINRIVKDLDVEQRIGNPNQSSTGLGSNVNLSGTLGAPSNQAPVLATQWQERINSGDLQGLDEAEVRKRLMREVKDEFLRTQTQLRKTLQELEERVKSAQALLERREQLVEQICEQQISDLVRSETNRNPLSETNPFLGLQRIQSERIAILTDKVAEIEARHANGEVPLDEVLQARNRLIAAQLESGPSDEERVQLLQSLVDLAVQIEAQMNQRYKLGLVSTSELQSAKLNRLKSEEELAKLKEPKKSR